MATTLIGAVESDSNAANGVAGNLVINVPSGTANGDLLIAFVYKAADSVHTLTQPAGWTAASPAIDTTNINASVWYRVANGEPASYTWTISSTGIWGVAQFTLRGVDVRLSINAAAGQSYTTEDPATAPSVTATRIATIITCRASRDDSTTEVTHSSGTAGTELIDWGFDGGVSTRNGALYYSVDQPPGAYGFAVDPSGSVTNGVMFTLAVSTLVNTAAVGPRQAIRRASLW